MSERRAYLLAALGGLEEELILEAAEEQYAMIGRGHGQNRR